MASITEVALKFFDACETGKGWQGCQQYCTPNATFRSEASPLAAMTTLAEYTNWMQGLFTPIPDGRYQIRSFATITHMTKIWNDAVAMKGLGWAA
jgi:hypothetical protein